MICDNCGMSVAETAKFCSGCGLSIATGSTGVQPGGIARMASPSPVSALSMDPPRSQSSLTVTCVIHSASGAAAACVGCGNFYCRDCLIRHEGRNYCRNCAARFSSPQPQNVTTYQDHQAGRSLTIPPEPQPSHYPQQVPYQYQMQSNGYARPPYVKRKERAVVFLLSFSFRAPAKFIMAMLERELR